VKTSRILLGFAVITVLLAPWARASVYDIDPDHSSVALHATHLGIGTVEGRFDDFSGTVEFDSTHITLSKVTVRIKAASINTNQPVRDEHLRSADFLDVEKYPFITFESTEVTKSKSGDLQVAGNLTLHGVTRRVVLPVRLRGTGVDMDGKKRVGFDTSTQINRKDYGMTWNRLVAGNMLVGQTVMIFLNIEGVERTADDSK